MAGSIVAGVEAEVVPLRTRRAGPALGEECGGGGGERDDRGRARAGADYGGGGCCDDSALGPGGVGASEEGGRGD